MNWLSDLGKRASVGLIASAKKSGALAPLLSTFENILDLIRPGLGADVAKWKRLKYAELEGQVLNSWADGFRKCAEAIKLLEESKPASTTSPKSTSDELERARRNVAVRLSRLVQLGGSLEVEIEPAAWDFGQAQVPAGGSLPPLTLSATGIVGDTESQTTVDRQAEQTDVTVAPSGFGLSATLGGSASLDATLSDAPSTEDSLGPKDS